MTKSKSLAAGKENIQKLRVRQQKPIQKCNNMDSDSKITQQNRRES